MRDTPLFDRVFGSSFVTPVFDDYSRGASYQNLLLYSEELENTAWFSNTSSGNTFTRTDDYADGPEAGARASRIQMTLGGGTGTAYLRQVVSGLTAGSGAIGLWVKSNDANSYSVFVGLNGSGSNRSIGADWAFYQYGRNHTGSMDINIGLRDAWGTGSDADILIWAPRMQNGTLTLEQDEYTKTEGSASL